jgi:hypothetical protein
LGGRQPRHGGSGSAVRGGRAGGLRHVRRRKSGGLRHARCRKSGAEVVCSARASPWERDFWRLAGAAPARFRDGGNPAGSLYAHKRKLAPHQLGFESLCCRTSSAPPSLLLDPPHLLKLYCQTSRLRCWPSRLRRCTRSYWSAIPCSSLCCWTRSHCFAIPAAPPSSIPNTFLVLDVSMC